MIVKAMSARAYTLAGVGEQEFTIAVFFAGVYCCEVWNHTEDRPVELRDGGTRYVTYSEGAARRWWERTAGEEARW